MSDISNPASVGGHVSPDRLLASPPAPLVNSTIPITNTPNTAGYALGTPVVKTGPILPTTPAKPSVAQLVKGAVPPVIVSSMEISTQRARVILEYGDSGLWKTTSIGFLARYVYQKFGKITRLISADGGGWKPVQDYIDAGLIEPLSIVKVKNPLPVVRRLSRGLWPDKNGKLVETSREKWEQIGAYAMEGLTSVSELLLEDCREKQLSIGQDAVGKFEEDGEKFSKNSMTHYDFVQCEGMAMLRALSALPVNYVLVTAHEAKSEEEGAVKTAIRGPALVGKAKTASVQKNVGTLLHYESYPYTEEIVQGKDKYFVERTKVRVFYERHADPLSNRTYYPAKSTVPPDRIGELRKRFPGGFFLPTPQEGLDLFLAAEDELMSQATGSVVEWKKKVDEARAAPAVKK